MAKDTETRKQILTSAARLFGERSFSRVSIRDIASNVGVTPASLYYYFDSKEEILDELIRHYVRVHERFYEKTVQQALRSDYSPKINDIVYRYDDQESELMFWITRIVYMEQFQSTDAADALVGTTAAYVKKGYQVFLKALADRGFINNRRNISDYIDILFRAGRSYQLDHLHPDIASAPGEEMTQTYAQLIKLFMIREGTADRYRQLLP